MSTVLFVSKDAVKQRMAINPANTEVDPFIESAIHAAQLRMESEYGSSFGRQENEDLFFLDGDSFSGVRMGGVFRLQLKNAFVVNDSAHPVVITYSSKWNEEGAPVPERDYMFDPLLGIVQLDESYKDRYVKVTYTSGFEGAQDMVPWMAEAILAYTPVVFNFGQTTNRNDEAEKNYKASGDHALAVLVPYRRNRGFTFRPLQ